MESDIADAQAGTTKEGIHLGVMAATLDLLQRAYLGTEILDDVVYFKPTAQAARRAEAPAAGPSHPDHRFGQRPRVTVTVPAEGYIRPITVSIHGLARELKRGESCTFELQPRPDAIDDIDYTGGKALVELGE